MDLLNLIAYEIPKLDAAPPIVIVGAGSIVQDAHLPAYRLAGLNVQGIYDLDQEKTKSVARKFDIPHMYGSIQELVQKNGTSVVYDIAVPGFSIATVLEQLPDRSFVLLQKPMGEDLAQATEILKLCEQKRMVAGVNFQLRYAPYIIMAKKMLDVGMIGEICDIEVHVNVYTPWYLWDFLFSSPRVEILYHSIHYIDLIRHILGNPHGVFAKTMKHPLMKNLHSVRSNIIMNYGDELRANVITNHTHDFGSEHQNSYLKIEGTKGAIKIQMGLNMNYPIGSEDKFEYFLTVEDGSKIWQRLPINGSWFPHGFIGSMAQLIQAKEHRSGILDNSVRDCYDTMVCVEAAYNSVIPAIDWLKTKSI